MKRVLNMMKSNVFAVGLVVALSGLGCQSLLAQATKPPVSAEKQSVEAGSNKKVDNALALAVEKKSWTEVGALLKQGGIYLRSRKTSGTWRSWNFPRTIPRRPQSWQRPCRKEKRGIPRPTSRLLGGASKTPRRRRSGCNSYRKESRKCPRSTQWLQDGRKKIPRPR